ncbi:T9SS type A sorting domain-containing protein [candidate division WOR-3 bacterium]|nr:T9SS type A sorting domain-containing protein [candidate division WOR-3 bacterium]
MKRYRVLFGALAIGAFVVTGLASGKVSSEVKNNTAYVHHDSAWFNCCQDMSFEIKPNPDTAGIIDICERDLGTHPCYCMCYFDFTHILEGLEPGDYLARVWEASYDEEYTLAGVTSFVIKARLTPYTITTLMSECYGAEGAEEPPASPHTGLELTNASANPTRQSAQIRYFLPADARVALEIYDVIGTRIRTLNVGSQEQGEHLLVWDIRNEAGQSVPRGIYFVRLKAAGEARSLRLIVLR